MSRFLILAAILLFTSPISSAEDLIYKGKDIIRNGGFENDIYDVWIMSKCDNLSSAAKDGNIGLEMGRSHHKEVSSFIQPIMFPTELHSAKIRFDISAKAKYKNSSLSPSQNPVLFEVSFAIFSDGQFHRFGYLASDILVRAFNWSVFEKQLDLSLVDTLQKGRDMGAVIYIYVSSSAKNETHGLNLFIDNFSLKVDGIQKIPAMKGKIAYLKNISSKRNAIHIIDPNDGSETIPWSLEKRVSIAPIDSVSWKPDGTELAFISGHEFLYSTLYSDVYAIKPNGEGFRRVTNRPSHEEILKGNYPRIKVKGKIVNQTGRKDCHNIFLALEGAPVVKHLQSCVEHEEIPFEINDVALLGNKNIFEQKLVFYWNNTDCIAGLDFTGTNVIVKRSVADLGTITFTPFSCLKAMGYHRLHDVSWSRDGSEIGLKFVSDFYKVDASGSRLYGEKVGVDSTLSSGFRWSPVDNRILYTNYSVSFSKCIHVLKEDGTSENLVCTRQNVVPAWLPDGSGFIYVYEYDNAINIYHYDLTTKEKRQLTFFYNEKIQDVSVSPSGNFVVFERFSELSRYGGDHRCDLWILDRRNPAEMWQLTNNGMSYKPEWSRTDVVIEEKKELIEKKKATDEKGEGDGGCFINLISVVGNILPDFFTCLKAGPW